MGGITDCSCSSGYFPFVRRYKDSSRDVFFRCFTGIYSGKYRLDYKTPDQERPFEVPLSIGKVPVLPILAILISAMLAVQYQWQVYAAFAGAIVAGIVLDYFLDRRPKKDLDPEEEKELFSH